MTLVSVNVYIDKLDDTLNEIKYQMKPVDVKSNPYIHSNK